MYGSLPLRGRESQTVPPSHSAGSVHGGVIAAASSTNLPSSLSFPSPFMFLSTTSYSCFHSHWCHHHASSSKLSSIQGTVSVFVCRHYLAVITFSVITVFIPFGVINFSFIHFIGYGIVDMLHLAMVEYIGIHADSSPSYCLSQSTSPHGDYL